MQGALQHFQAMIEKDPQLVGKVGTEQVKTCAAAQVLRVGALSFL